MRRLICTFALLLLVAPAWGQVPPSADSLADWQPPSEVTTYTDGDDTLHVLGDSTWVARQETVTIGCELGPDGGFWVYEPHVLLDEYVASADTSLTHDDFQAASECIWYVQVLWRYEEGLLP